MLTSKPTETRRNERQKVLDLALVRFGDASVCCVLRNLSDSGAALDIRTGQAIPDQFTLIRLQSDCIYSCSVVWRSRHRVGVSFN